MSRLLCWFLGHRWRATSDLLPVRDCERCGQAAVWSLARSRWEMVEAWGKASRSFGWWLR